MTDHFAKHAYMKHDHTMTSFIHKTFLIGLSISAFTLTGCQQIQTSSSKTPITTLPEKQANTATVVQKQFKITGKIGVRTPQQNGSAFYGWTQIGDQFAIDLTGALGIGQTSIRGKAGDVTLTSSKTGAIQAATPEELLYKATKWQAPITYLVSWVNAQPVTADAHIEKDAQQRISTIQEGGWHATLSYAQQENLPNKLVLLDDAKQNRVTLTIQTRE